ncbi:hypothetical protein J6590_082940 [Homalodisca vitripennis]|nr:hypothetical protein J6590_082940 [Homalodisca vitripennis]
MYALVLPPTVQGAFLRAEVVHIHQQLWTGPNHRLEHFRRDSIRAKRIRIYREPPEIDWYVLVFPGLVENSTRYL